MRGEKIAGMGTSPAVLTNAFGVLSNKGGIRHRKSFTEIAGMKLKV